MRTIGSLFSGIGGLDLGLERAGLGPILWQAEADPYCRAVLARHWPGVVRYDDVAAVTAETARPWLLCGGFPCQPVSVAGKRRAQADERWLWPAFARVAEIAEPAVVLVENVPGLRTAGLRDVLADLAALGFDAEWSCLGAGENPNRRHGWPHVGAPHERRRLFVVATHAHRTRLRHEPGWFARALWAITCEFATVGESGSVANTAGDRDTRSESSGWPTRSITRKRGRRNQPTVDAVANTDRAWQLQQAIRSAEARGWACDSGWRVAPSAIRGMDDGLPAGLDGASDGQRIAALGNAVVVRVAEVVGRAIVAATQEPLRG